MGIFKNIFGKKKTQSSPKEDDKGKYMPEESLPVDELFTVNFMKNGGKFIYCDSMDEVYDNFDHILNENNWQSKSVLCYDSSLKQNFKHFKLDFNTQATSASFFLTTCESLIADKGSILISSNQIKEQKLDDLPDSFVLFATTSQLKETISEGLRAIKNNQQKQIPSNITTLKHFQSSKENDFMTYGTSTKNLYLLLLEDL
ncbi:MAG: LUD domain-containing protein [Flavobacteriaceae bacterium]